MSPPFTPSQLADVQDTWMFLVERARRYGVNITLETDFHELTRLSEWRLKASSYVTFNPDYFPIDESDGVWISGRLDDGELVYTLAIRLSRLGSRTLAQHLIEERALYRHKDENWDLIVDSPEIHAITGNVSYTGMFWIKPTSHSGPGLLRTLAPMCQMVSTLRWAPSFNFGIMGTKNVNRGLYKLMGDTMYGDALCWTDPQTGEIVKRETISGTDPAGVLGLVQRLRSKPR